MAAKEMSVIIVDRGIAPDLPSDVPGLVGVRSYTRGALKNHALREGVAG
jgi:hypothetical protein